MRETVRPSIAMPKLFTIGHSTRTFEEFASILEAHGVSVLVDVRTVPRSRRVPQFNADALARDLARRGIEYVPMPELGGLRKARKDSINLGWRNQSFRGYADYMQTPAFQAGLEQLIEVASSRPTAIMCAEAVPWRCHRSLIADAMIARGWKVMDLMGPHSAKEHKLTDFAKVQGTKVTYPVISSEYGPAESSTSASQNPGSRVRAAGKAPESGPEAGGRKPGRGRRRSSTGQ